MALTVRWYNGAPYLTEDTSKTTDPVWYNAAPNVEYYEYVAPASGATAVAPIAMANYRRRRI